MEEVEFEILLGKTLSGIEISEDRESLKIAATDGFDYKMFHEQECCEYVSIEDVVGDLSDLIGSPILLAEKVTSDEDPQGISKGEQESFTWTFYKLSTIKGSVTIRWYGESNGYYSEDVSIFQTRQPQYNNKVEGE